VATSAYVKPQFKSSIRNEDDGCLVHVLHDALIDAAWSINTIIISTEHSPQYRIKMQSTI